MSAAREPAAIDTERVRRRRQRSLAIAALLVLLVVVFYVVTLIQLGGSTGAAG